MFDTMTMTKVIGGLCGTFLVFLLGGWAAELIYHGSGGHDDHHEAAFVIHAEEGGEEVEVEEEVPFEVLLAEASVEDGEGLWRNCRSCHAVEDGVNGTGPHLYGIVGRNVASVDGFNYSGALTEVAEVWTAENLNGFLENPSGWAPGTAMSYNGMRSAEDRADLIAYLDSIDD